MKPLRAYIEGIGLLAPGLNGWSAGAPLLAQPERLEMTPLVVPAPDCLPPAERRRVGVQIKVALAVGREAAAHARRDPATLANVFSASSGDGDNCHAICETLAGTDRLISPTRFHNSVHNAPAGYWGIAMKCMAPSTSLCAHDGSFAAGLLEAVVQARASAAPVLLICADAPYPEPLNSVRPLSHAMGVALVVSPTPGTQSLACMELALDSAPQDILDAATLQTLYTANPVGRALPLLRALATGIPQTVRLHYQPACTLAVTLGQPDSA